MAQFKDNPLFVEVHVCEAAGVTFYAPAHDTEYHKSRELAMQVQDVYNRCGISRDVLQHLVTVLIDKANTADLKTLRTDVGVIGNNIQYRINNSIDEQCALRMGAYGCFIEGEDPNNLNEAWTARKLELAAKNQDVHDFFLTLGVQLIPEYATALRGLEVREYFQNRQTVIDGMTLPSIQTT